MNILKPSLIILFAAWAALGGDIDPLAGRGAPYLRLGIGARAQAMGNAHVAFLEPTTVAPYWNPAMLVMYANKFTASTGYRFMSLGRREGHLSFAGKVPPRMAYGVALLYHGDHDVPIFDDDGAWTYDGGFFSLAVHVAVAYKLNRRLALGLNTTIHSNSLSASEDEVFQIHTWELGNVDLAAYYRVWRTLTLGVNVKEIKSRMNWEAPTYGTDLNTVIADTLPLDIKMGAAYRHTIRKIPFAFTFDTDVYLIPQADSAKSIFTRLWDGRSVLEPHFGVEAFIYPVFPVRLGVGLNEGFSAGLGFYFLEGRFKNAKLDYVFSIEPNGSGLNNGVSWTYAW